MQQGLNLDWFRLNLEGLVSMNIIIALHGLMMLLLILGIVSISVFEDRLIAYSFMGAGIILSVISLIMNRKKET